MGGVGSFRRFYISPRRYKKTTRQRCQIGQDIYIRVGSGCIIRGKFRQTSSSMTPEVDSDLQSNAELSTALWSPEPEIDGEISELDESSTDVEMSFFAHLEELRQRIFYAVIAVAIGAVGCFVFAKQIVQILEIPAAGIKFLQLAPGEYFFVSVKVAGYCGLLVASPVVLYQIIQFVVPGLTRRERQLVLPVVAGSSVLFVGGIAFAFYVLIPAALNFLIGYGESVVEQAWSIDKYFEFVLVLLFATGLLFELPVVQVILSLLGILSSKMMLAGWQSVVVGSMVVGAIVTPSTDPLTQSLLAGAVLALYFGGVGVVKLLGK
jgi:sec-independent protein translocase protein TatC